MKATRRGLFGGPALGGRRTGAQRAIAGKAGAFQRRRCADALLAGDIVCRSGVHLRAWSRRATDIKEQTRLVLDEIAMKLEGAGSSMEKVLKCNVYRSDIEHYAAMNEAYRGRFGAEPPMHTTWL